MLQRFLHTSDRDSAKGSTVCQGSFGLQVVLWALWTLVMIVVAYANVYDDMIAQRPINSLGLVIHCLVAGMIGLVVMTYIEIHLEPWRLVDTER